MWPTTLRLGEARVNEIARCANLRRFHQGQYIVTEGEVGLTFYIIVSGAADDSYNGRYERLSAECNDKPVYQLDGSGSHAAAPCKWPCPHLP